jgi:hypothetical protein
MALNASNGVHFGDSRPHGFDDFSKPPLGTGQWMEGNTTAVQFGVFRRSLKSDFQQATVIIPITFANHLPPCPILNAAEK